MSDSAEQQPQPAPDVQQSGGVHLGAHNTITNSGDIFGGDKHVHIDTTLATAAARRVWLERLAACYDVLPPASATSAPEADLDTVDAPYIISVMTHYRMTEQQAAQHVTEARVKLFEWATRDANHDLVLPEYATPAMAQLALAVILMPVLELHIYDTLTPAACAALRRITSPALTELIQHHCLVYYRATTDMERMRVARNFAAALAQPQYADGIRKLLRYLLYPARWKQALAEVAFYAAIQGAPISVAAHQRNCTPAPQHHVGSAFLLRLLELLVSGTATVLITDLLVRGGDSLVRQVWQQINTPAPSHAAPAQAAAPVQAPPATQPTQRLSIPVTAAEWRDELQRRNRAFGQPAGYWCYVRPGTYTIGGWEQDQPSASIALQEFWIAKVPITNAQFAPFVRAGYGRAARRWWTPNGWAWREGNKRTQPGRWGEKNFDAPNQPVISVTWYEATAFCAWLAEQLALPAGYALCLPTEAEWEAAAYDAAMRRHDYPWGDAALTPERAVYDRKWQDGQPPVGSRPAGAAACGALDMAGTVWECAASEYERYPASSNISVKDFTVDTYKAPWRGGSYGNDSTYVRCGARIRDVPYHWYGLNGFRVVVAPRAQ